MKLRVQKRTDNEGMTFFAPQYRKFLFWKYFTQADTTWPSTKWAPTAYPIQHHDGEFYSLNKCWLGFYTALEALDYNTAVDRNIQKRDPRKREVIEMIENYEEQEKIKRKYLSVTK